MSFERHGGEQVVCEQGLHCPNPPAMEFPPNLLACGHWDAVPPSGPLLFSELC